MKTNIKKLAACMLALLMVFQMVSAFADESVSNTVQTNSTFLDQLEITSPQGTTIAVGQTIQLETTEGYNQLTWTSSNEEVATVANGAVTGVSAGNVKIKAEQKINGNTVKDTIIIKVVAGSTPATESEAKAEDEESDETLLIVINGNKDKIEYDGQEHTYSGFTVIPESEQANIRLKNEDKLITARDCKTYTIDLSEDDFEYTGSAANVQIVANSGWMQIKPAKVIVKANDAVQKDGEDVEFTATVTGLMEGDDPDVIQYTFELLTAGSTTYITPVCEQVQGNYRVTAQAGILTIEGETPRSIKLTSDWPEDEPAYEGTMITMTAELTGFENVNYRLRWQHSTDMQEWIDEPGANDISFTYELNETTAQYTWRVVADY